MKMKISKKMYKAVLLLIAAICLMMPATNTAYGADDKTITDNFGYYPTELDWSDKDEFIVKGCFYNLNTDYDIYDIHLSALHLYDKNGKEIISAEFGEEGYLEGLIVPAYSQYDYNFGISDYVFDSAQFDLTSFYATLEGTVSFSKAAEPKPSGSTTQPASAAEGQWSVCTSCRGSGRTTCGHCGGTGSSGYDYYRVPSGTGSYSSNWNTTPSKCYYCMGTGKDYCMSCGGLGKIPSK